MQDVDYQFLRSRNHPRWSEPKTLSRESSCDPCTRTRNRTEQGDQAAEWLLFWPTPTVRSSARLVPDYLRAVRTSLVGISGRRRGCGGRGNASGPTRILEPKHNEEVTPSAGNRCQRARTARTNPSGRSSGLFT